MMTNKLVKTTLAALAFVTFVSSFNVASASVGSLALDSVNTINEQIGEVETAPTKVHYRYYGHSHRRNHYNRGYGHRRSYNDGCRRVKVRHWDGYGYAYRWVRRCY